MFLAVTDAPPAPPAASTSRQEWLALLARAPIDLLDPALAPHARSAPRWLRSPETGLVMVQGRAGGSGERFNLGEVTVTRCALRLADAAPDASAVGVAYVLGRSHRQAYLVALADALLQDPARQAALELQLLAPLRRQLGRSTARRHARAQTTRVEFFTVARESVGLGAGAGAGAGEIGDA